MSSGMNNKNVLIVDTNPVNIAMLGKVFSNYHYACTGVSGYEVLDEALAGVASYDIVLMDVAGFDPGIWERCKVIHSAGVPFLIL